MGHNKLLEEMQFIKQKKNLISIIIINIEMIGISNYLVLLDQLLKSLLPENVYELFQNKLRDHALRKDPAFIWCSQCSSGFIASSEPCAQTVR